MSDRPLWSYGMSCYPIGQCTTWSHGMSCYPIGQCTTWSYGMPCYPITIPSLMDHQGEVQCFKARGRMTSVGRRCVWDVGRDSGERSETRGQPGTHIRTTYAHAAMPQYAHMQPCRSTQPCSHATVRTSHKYRPHKWQQQAARGGGIGRNRQGGLGTIKYFSRTHRRRGGVWV